MASWWVAGKQRSLEDALAWRVWRRKPQNDLDDHTERSKSPLVPPGCSGHAVGNTGPPTAGAMVQNEVAKVSSTYGVHPRILENARWYHTALDQEHMIRLLHLHPGKADDPVEGTLVYVSLLNSPRYDALSYSWGDHEHWKDAIIDGRTDYAVSLNLWHALRRLRSSGAVRSLWIDAICINQRDTTEKNAQVLDMSTIFASARSVVVWLGECEGYTSTPLRQISLKTDDFLSVLAEVTPNQSKAWWNRIWVIQEVAMAKELNVYLGPYILSGNEFFELAAGKPGWAAISNLRQIRTTVRSLGREYPTELVSVLSKSGNCYASDPLDYVFALCGLVGHRLSLTQSGLQPDYSLTLNELLIRLGRYIATCLRLTYLHIDADADHLLISVEVYRLILLQNWLVQSNHRELSRLLTESGMIPPEIDKTVSLIIASTYGQEKRVRSLLTIEDMEPNWTDVTGYSSLHRAIRAGHLSIIQILLEDSRVDVNLQSATGYTPLHYAISFNEEGAVRLLLDSARVKHEFGQPTEHLGWGFGTGINRLLLDRGIVLPPIVTAPSNPVVPTAARRSGTKRFWKSKKTRC